MRPRLVEFLGDWPGSNIFVPDYTLMLSIAILAGIYWTLRQAEEFGLNTQKVFRACLVMIVAALISARFYGVLQHITYYKQQPWEVFQYWKGDLASYGALIGGFVAALVAARWQKLPLARLLDCCAPSVALVIAFGRIGCLLNGCCYGKVSHLPWALRFPEGSDPYADHLQKGLIAPGELSLPVHPTQLYEAIYALLLFFILFRYRKNQRSGGKAFAILFILYPLGRFLNEFLRGDDRGFVFSLSLPQVFSIASIILAVSFLIMRNKEQSLITQSLS
jgi:phosphatidylglycerol:prolipoprotein diacylglycerol transferase